MRRALVTSYVVGMFLLLCAADWHGRIAAQPESWYQEHAAESLKGIREVVVDHGRVDVLTVTHAIEVDKLDKFKEGIGQALWYSWQTRRKPGLVLIVPPSAKSDWRSIRDVITNRTQIKVWLQCQSTAEIWD